MMLVELKAPFALQVRVIRYKYFDLFLLTEMEEHGDIDEHKATLQGYALCLSDLDYKIPDVLQWMGYCNHCIPARRISSVFISREKST